MDKHTAPLSVSRWICQDTRADAPFHPSPDAAQWGAWDRLQRALVLAGLVTVVGLWAAEDAGMLPVALQTPHRAAVTPPLPGSEPAMPAVHLQGSIPGDRLRPPAALLAEAGTPPRLVAEGAAYGEDIRVERVLPDRVVLHWRGSNAPVVVPLTPGATGGLAASAREAADPLAAAARDAAANPPATPAPATTPR